MLWTDVSNQRRGPRYGDQFLWIAALFEFCQEISFIESSYIRSRFSTPILTCCLYGSDEHANAMRITVADEDGSVFVHKYAVRAGELAFKGIVVRAVAGNPGAR